MRHAKAEPYGASDHERELSDRGRSDAAAAGTWLAAQGVVPDRALVSDAARTQDTWQAVAEAAGWETEPELDGALYTAGPETALDVIRLVPADTGCVIFIGHNPTAAYLAQMLDSGDGDQEASDAMSAGFPTAALTIFELDSSWADLDAATARVTGFHVGRA